MAYIRGEVRGQTTMFPVTLDELIPADHLCRVIEAVVERLDMAKLGLVRAEPAETEGPGYDPHGLLKLCLYGYVQQVWSSRRLKRWHAQRGASYNGAPLVAGSASFSKQVWCSGHVAAANSISYLPEALCEDARTAFFLLPRP